MALSDALFDLDVFTYQAIDPQKYTIKNASQQYPSPEQTHSTHLSQNNHTLPVHTAVSA